jgi:hypothetical protein
MCISPEATPFDSIGHSLVPEKDLLSREMHVTRSSALGVKNEVPREMLCFAIHPQQHCSQPKSGHSLAVESV